MVIFDDGNAILKRFTFDQPTAWLATELKRDPDLWNRHWVIAQLAGARPTWPRGRPRQATTVPITSSRASPRQRARGLPCRRRPARPADSDERHVGAGPRRRPRSPRHARRRAGRGTGAPGLERDSSDAVRAAAVAALARSDSVGRRAVLFLALRTPSYRDAVQNAAYGAIARWGDTTMVDSVDAHAGDQRFAPHVLAALASRGSTRALDLLVKHLDDERALRAALALEAFRFSLTRTLAQPSCRPSARVEVRRHQAGRR